MKGHPNPAKLSPQNGAATKREVFLLFLLTLSVLVNSRVSKNIIQSLRFPYPPKPQNAPLRGSTSSIANSGMSHTIQDTATSDKTFRPVDLASANIDIKGIEVAGPAHQKASNNDHNQKNTGIQPSTAHRLPTTHPKEPRVLPQPTFHGLYHNKHEVVHVIYTRFMQHQPHLDHLARGRLQLFESITLPSLLNQSNKQFLWIIWLEPQLDTSIKRQLLDMLRKVRETLSIIVIGSDAKLPDLRSNYFDELMESNFYLGDPLLLEDYREAAQTRVLLETTLDSDDAVFVDFVATMQSEAAITLAVTSLDTGDYRFWCASQSLYWHYYDPWKKGPNGTPSKRGALVSINHMKSDKECPAGGFTKGYAVGTMVEDLPQVMRHEIHTKAVACDYVEHKCIRRWDAGAAEFAILRTRTPLAVGAADVLLTLSSPSSKLLHNNLQNRQNQMWSRVELYFGIAQKAVLAMRADMEENMLPMILDGMQGLCMPGHSCKRQDKDALKTLKRKYKYPSESSATSAHKNHADYESAKYVQKRRD